jgi:hypothetical protein
MQVIKKLALGFIAVTLACGTAFADSITFQTAAGTNETTGGKPVAAQALVTTSNGLITVTLSNLLGINGNPSISNAGQLLSDFEFTLSSSSNSVSYASGSGTANLIDIGSGGVVTAASPASTTALGWGLGVSGDTVSLNGLGGTNTPGDLLVGAACGSGTYCNANSSIASNGPHNPFALNGTTFSITDSAVTDSTTVSAATFSFGTASGDNAPGILVSTVPEPPTVLLFGTCMLLGLAFITRRRAARYTA